MFYVLKGGCSRHFVKKLIGSENQTLNLLPLISCFFTKSVTLGFDQTSCWLHFFSPADLWPAWSLFSGSCRSQGWARRAWSRRRRLEGSVFESRRVVYSAAGVASGDDDSLCLGGERRTGLGDRTWWEPAESRGPAGAKGQCSPIVEVANMVGEKKGIVRLITIVTLSIMNNFTIYLFIYFIKDWNFCAIAFQHCTGPTTLH